ncbi:MAG TPA: ABC transporter ATP-binding protein [Saprospiraceae bacterium]|nr:ABC transporter ATP-binding protein [Saprospiraceae bacterium]
MAIQNILQVENLHVSFTTKEKRIDAVKEISFHLKSNEVLGIVGESGSGKSVTALSLMHLLQLNSHANQSGTMHLSGMREIPNLWNEKESTWRNIRGKKIGMIFQEPSMFMNPSKKCGIQIAEAIYVHQKVTKAENYKKVIDWLSEVGLEDPERIYHSFPHQLSGGQLQRVMIAIALCNHPDILIADEPTTALDVIVQKNILRLIKELQKSLQLSVIIISHDLRVVSEIADSVLVMQNGLIIEEGLTRDIFEKPQQTYTRDLLKARPTFMMKSSRLPIQDLNIERKSSISSIKGDLEVESKVKKESQQVKSTTILEVNHLIKIFTIRTGGKKRIIRAVDDVSFSMKAGEVFGLVGESGSGKSTILQSISGLISFDSGNIHFNFSHPHLQKVNKYLQTGREIQMIFQDPYSSLNPRMKVGQAIMEPMNGKLSVQDKIYKTHQLLEKVGLESLSSDLYPHQFSGGQRQRICIARALAAEPMLLLCDECVSSLDVTTQAKILNLLKDLNEELSLSMLFISHDLSVVRFMSDTVAVLKNGKIVERNDSELIFMQPFHPYTRLLIQSVPGSLDQ